ncbi:MAG TPA: hypothetical protein DEA08_06790 [Planctomycetes bacterium]|nr:hypothetical protein [Planctomycetota bacterium]
MCNWTLRVNLLGKLGSFLPHFRNLGSCFFTGLEVNYFEQTLCEFLNEVERLGARCDELRCDKRCEVVISEPLSEDCLSDRQITNFYFVGL